MAKILKFLHQSIFDYLCLQNRWAEMLAKAAIKNLPQMKMRAEKSDGDLDYEENFYILKHTACPDIPTQPERNRIRRGLERLWILAADIQRLLHAAPIKKLLRNVRCMFVLHLEIAIDTTAISVSSETIFTSNNGYNTLLG